jgi:hypothetical protein
MAKMFPEIPNFLDICSHTQQYLYRLLKKNLSDEFTVFHAVKWQVKNFKGEVQDGQTDFIIVSPNLGILILNIQGGNVQWNEPQWYSDDQPIPDPFSQACDSKYSLLRLLKNQPFWLNKPILIGHAVAFPDMTIETSFGLHAPPEIILDQPQLFRLEDWTQSAMVYWQRRSNELGELDDQVISELIKVFYPSISILV